MWASIMNLVAPEPTPEDLLMSSIQQGRIDLLNQWLSTRGVDSLENIAYGEARLNVLHLACLHGNTQAVNILLDYFPFDKPTNGGNTCAHLAAMNGHSAIVDILIERGASPGVKNNQGFNVFDVAKGLQLRQTLMSLVLAEEQRNGTAPVIAGVTRDMTQDQIRLKNLPPPPTFPMTNTSETTTSVTPTKANSQPPQMYINTPNTNMNARPIPRPIQPDGFVTTVGNPKLAAAYGNQTQQRLDSPQADNNNPAFPATTTNLPPPVMATPSFTAPSRYVQAPPGVVVRPSSRPPPNASFRPVGIQPNRAVNVFNPSQNDEQGNGT